MYTEREQAYRNRILGKLDELRECLGAQNIDPDASPGEWYKYLNQVKQILGNPNQDLSFVSTLLAKYFILERFGESGFDAAEKPQGAHGLDVDVIVSGKRIVGEIKTTIPYNGSDFGAQQMKSFERDFVKLAKADADHKFMFVTESATFDILRRPSYQSKLQDVTIVQLVSGDEFRHESE